MAPLKYHYSALEEFPVVNRRRHCITNASNAVFREFSGDFWVFRGYSMIFREFSGNSKLPGGHTADSCCDGFPIILTIS